jgi:hypothetical protein
MDKSKNALRRRLSVNGATGPTDHQMRLTAAQQGHPRALSPTTPTEKEKEK